MQTAENDCCMPSSSSAAIHWTAYDNEAFDVAKINIIGMMDIDRLDTLIFVFRLSVANRGTLSLYIASNVTYK